MQCVFMFALCASSSLCPIQSFVCVTFFKNVQLPHQGYCVATHQYIYVYNYIRIHRLYINTQCCESNMCICVWVYGKYLYFACQSLRKKTTFDWTWNWLCALNKTRHLWFSSCDIYDSCFIWIFFNFKCPWICPNKM